VTAAPALMHTSPATAKNSANMFRIELPLTLANKSPSVYVLSRPGPRHRHTPASARLTADRRSSTLNGLEIRGAAQRTSAG